MNYTIRELKPSEYKVLADFLYEAIFIPNEIEPPAREIINQPKIQVYIKECDKEDDNVLVAEIDGKIVGAVWTRIITIMGILIPFLLQYHYTRNIEVLVSEQK